MNRKLVQTHPLAELGLSSVRNAHFEGEHSTFALERQNINTGTQADDKHANTPALASAGAPEFKQHYCESFSQTDLTHMQSWRSHLRKAILTPSLLYSPAWCFLCYAGTSFCVAAQCTGCRN